ncbi:MAG: glycosyltransferase family 1 protein, partial [Actinobacteria bacterium]|nr:glycosyltransferase family 1 protein [Actinomycetota bacterium]
MTADHRTIAIDARKLGDTGVGRHIQGLLAGLGRLPDASSFGWRAFSTPDRWRHIRESPPGMARTMMHASPYSPLQHPEGYALLRRYPTDLFHATHFTTPLVLPRRTRLLVTIHDAHLLDRPDLVSDGRHSRFRLLAYRLLMNLAAHRANLITTVSHAGADDLRRLLPQTTNKLRVVPNSLDTSRFQHVSSLAGDADGVVLFAGSLTRRKGVGVLLEAFAANMTVRRSFRLALVGPASADTRAFEAQIDRLGIRDRVVVPGPVASDDDLIEWYRQARVVVLPSFLESFGYPVLEAMAMGIPCVASDLPATREVASGAALLVPPGDVMALGEALERACFENPLRTDLIARGLARA